MGYTADLFNETAPPRPLRKVKDVLYKFFSGVNKHKVGGNASMLEMHYEDGSTFRCMVDPGDLCGDNRRLEDDRLTDCDSIIADTRAYFDYHDGETLHKAEKPLDFIVLSHSHRDHIGAISKLMLMGYEMPPIYATPYTKQRLYQHLNNENIPPEEWPQVTEVAAGQTIHREGVDVNFFSASHSTPQSLGIVFKTDEGTIVHSCDWKKDDSLIWGPGFDEGQYKRMAGDNVSLLLMDSTGADSNKKPVTEHDFRETLREIFAANPGKRFIMATHPGFEENMASIAKVAAEHNKTMYVDSWSHDQVFSALKQTGLELSDHIDAPVEIRSLNSNTHQRACREAPPESSVVLVAGVMGQKNSSLVRAAFDRSKTLDLDPENDVILFCGPNMPGRDKENKFALMAQLQKRGFKIMGHPEFKLYPHAHARQSEIKYLAKISNPHTVVPVHGDGHLREANKELLEKAGHKVCLAENGQALRLKNGKVSRAKEYDEKPEYIGFETRRGSHWTDRDYIVKMTANMREAANDSTVDDPKERRKPRLFGHHRRF